MRKCVKTVRPSFLGKNRLCFLGKSSTRLGNMSTIGRILAVAFEVISVYLPTGRSGSLLSAGATERTHQARSRCLPMRQLLSCSTCLQLLLLTQLQLVVKYVSPAPAVSNVVPTPTVYAAPAPVVEYISPASAAYAAPEPIVCTLLQHAALVTFNVLTRHVAIQADTLTCPPGAVNRSHGVASLAATGSKSTRRAGKTSLSQCRTTFACMSFLNAGNTSEGIALESFMRH